MLSLLLVVVVLLLLSLLLLLLVVVVVVLNWAAACSSPRARELSRDFRGANTNKHTTTITTTTTNNNNNNKNNKHNNNGGFRPGDSRGPDLLPPSEGGSWGAAPWEVQQCSKVSRQGLIQRVFNTSYHN